LKIPDFHGTGGREERILVKKIILQQTGGPEVFQVVEVDPPRPGPREVVVDLRAIGLNWSEVMIRRGEWPLDLSDGFTLGSEGAGLVQAVGEEVRHVAPGERVAVFDVDAYQVPGQGTYAELIVVAEDKVLKIPPGPAFAEAAALPMALLTAYDALVLHSPLPESGNVVVTACTGAVGLAALQIARLKGLRVIGTTRNESKTALIRQLGCDVVVESNPERLKEKIADLLGGEQVNYVFDPIQGPVAGQLLQIMAAEGTYVVYGALGGMGFSVPASFLFHQLKVHGYVVLAHLADPARLQRVWSELYPLLEENQVRVPVAGQIPFPDAGAAQSAMETHSHFGKLVMVR